MPDIDKANRFFPNSGFLPRADAAGLYPPRGQARLHHRPVGEGDRDRRHARFPRRRSQYRRGNRVAGTRCGDYPTRWHKSAEPWAGGCVLPAIEPAMAYRILAPEAYVQIKHIIEKTVASSLIYLNSHARDFKTPELRGYLTPYVFAVPPWSARSSGSS